MAYDSLEAIEKDFGKRIKDTDSDDEKRELGIGKREAIAEFKERDADARILEAHRTAVIAEKGLAEWGDMVTGSTREEIDAKAATIAERVAKLSAVANDAAAKAGYGSAGAAGGAVAATQEAPEVEQLHDFEKRFNESTRGSAIRRGNDAKISVQEAEAYVRQIGSAPILDHLARNAARPQVRQVAQSYDLKTLKPKA